ncbi:ABC transporter ATP-binding protein [Paenibacillus radicis (ex Xue et al. 2023)]|uniref:ABC transporter ATP-binding protein/permease n=1 Tax=Paenibacillus radicis (ex Xue et al. 2023) TaxID=2972489 RepID=A0ABT1YQG4_9BACL|nr:ABC transporter ATP-binding protein [Paenibacillus radicis (ex Xue et al. 2023)]MCR8635419.1 ABC transporter ATP-binding protein/permease [Paenibacillus radicis (ex Xue et al. 2023)]
MIERFRCHLLVIKQYFSLHDIQRAFSILLPYIAGQWKAYLGLFVCVLIDISLTLSFAWFLGDVTDTVVQGQLYRMKWLIPLGAALIVLSIISTYYDIYFEAVAVNAVKKELKTNLYQHILLLPIKNVSSFHSGQLLSNFTNDIHSIDGVIGRSLVDLIKLPLISIAVFIYLVQISWELSLISLLIAPAAIISGAVFGLMLRRNSSNILNLAGSMNSLLNETFQGFFVIRAFTLEHLFHKKYSSQNRELFALEIKDAKIRGRFHAGGDGIGSMVYLMCLCLGAYFVSSNVITVGSLLAFVNLTNHLVYPLTGLAALWAGFQRSVSAVERISKVLEQPVDSTVLPQNLLPQPFLKSIQFHNITFSYDGQHNLFDDFNLIIPAGKVVAIVGASGAGKSTLFNLLQGFYKPQSGVILVDDKSTEELSDSQLRSYFAHVPQETFLFDGTVMDNLLVARRGITRSDIVQAAAIANIHSFIQSLPDGYETHIGERGVRLSGGQKQRIAIARAILKNSPILLMDEATSALDSETEYQVKEALDHLMINRTTLVIAHRLSTIRNADWIIVLDQGKIVQTGRHEELITRQGMYRNLYDSFVRKGVAAVGR